MYLLRLIFIFFEDRRLWCGSDCKEAKYEFQHDPIRSTNEINS